VIVIVWAGDVLSKVAVMTTVWPVPKVRVSVKVLEETACPAEIDSAPVPSGTTFPLPVA
jgi:hypothetical protein